MSGKEDKMKELLKIKDKMIDAVVLEFAKGTEAVDVDETGKVIDMIYDISKAEKNCYEAEYYKTVIEAMEDAEEERYGYTRYPRKRPMPWYKPLVDQEPYIEDYLDDIEYGGSMRMGYTGPWVDHRSGGKHDDGRSGKHGDVAGDYDGQRGVGKFPSHRGEHHEEEYEEEYIEKLKEDMRYGKPFNEYRMSKKHYTQTKSPADKNEMTSHANEHIADVVTTVREMWKDADTELKKQMKASLTGLLGEMNG